MTEEELNALIAHAHRRIEQLQRQLAAQQTLERQRGDEALKHQQELDDVLASEHLADERRRWEEEVELLKEEWQHEARVAFEGDLRQQLSRQAAAHSDHLGQVLRAQQQELEAIHQVALGEAIQAERDNFRTQVASYIARLQGIEAAVEGQSEYPK